jgi:transposase-like protein
MAKVNYVVCPSCHRDYYIEKMLSKALTANPGLMLKCPFCKLDFNLEKGPTHGKASSPDPQRQKPAGC